MQRTLQALALFALLLSTTGCFKYVVKTGSGGDVSRPPATSVWNHHFVNGLVGESAIDVKDLCPSGDATIRIERNLIDSLLGNITGNILWNPSHVEVFCGGSAAALELDDEKQRAFAKSELFLEAVENLAPERLDEALALQAQL